jgi:hypothetical protein
LGMSAVTTGPSCFISYGCFPEFVPASHQYLLTVLSIWWALGQLLGSLVGLSFYFSWPTSSSVKTTGCVATNREFLLPDHVSAFAVSAL